MKLTTFILSLGISSYFTPALILVLGGLINTPRTTLSSLPPSTLTSPTSPTLSSPTSTSTSPSSSTKSPPPPSTTPPPTLLLDAAGTIQIPTLEQKWHLTTYYTCIPRGTSSACGWHEPVLPGGDEIAGVSGRGVGRGVLFGIGAGWVAWGWMGGW